MPWHAVCVLRSAAMKLVAIALDYDGTLTRDGRLSRTVVDAIDKRAAHRRSGHWPPPHLASDTDIGAFDAVVARTAPVSLGHGAVNSPAPHPAF